MDCKQSEIFMMQHFEKTIKPANASRLAKHVLICEPCRELYLTLDEAMECANAEEFSKAPESFTESVMAMVRAEELYSKVVAVTVTADSEAGGQIILRIIWSISAILLGIGLLFMLNPDMLSALMEAYPVMETVVNVFYSAGVFISNVGERIAQSGISFSADNLGVTALLFVAVMGTLLYVLHSGEKVKT